jgi:hypothetical protein
VSQVFPIEDDYNAVRRELWLATDNAYKEAAKNFNAKESAINQQNLSQKELDLPDFSSIPVQTVLIDSKRDKIDLKKLEDIAKELSKVFMNFTDFIQSKVNISVVQSEAYFLNSEGVKYKQPYQLISLKASASTYANDGELLKDEYSLLVNRMEQLPTEDELKRRITEMATLLNQLRIAPVIGDLYSGAVLFEGEAVAEIVSQAFFLSSNSLISKRKPLEDKSAMTITFMSFDGGGSKDNKYNELIGKQIMDKNLSVQAIDKTRAFEEKPLIGSYEIDAEGVSAKDRIPLVENGVLQALLSDRIPSNGVSQSTGHKRLVWLGELQPRLVPGVIEISAKKTASADKMKKQLIDIAKKNGDEYAYIVRKIGSPATIDFAAMMSGKTPAERPTYVYRVSVKDGTETLVRTTTFSKITMDNFKEVLAVSEKKQAWNLPCASTSRNFQGQEGGAYASYIVPKGILLSGIELKKNDDVSLQKAPVTPNPLK